MKKTIDKEDKHEEDHRWRRTQMKKTTDGCHRWRSHRWRNKCRLLTMCGPFHKVQTISSVQLIQSSADSLTRFSLFHQLQTVSSSALMRWSAFGEKHWTCWQGLHLIIWYTFDETDCTWWDGIHLVRFAALGEKVCTWWNGLHLMIQSEMMRRSALMKKTTDVNDTDEEDHRWRRHRLRRQMKKS